MAGLALGQRRAGGARGRQGLLSADEWFQEIAHYDNGSAFDVRYHIVRAWQGEILNREFHDMRWVSKDDLSLLEHLSGNQTIIERLASEGSPR